MNGRIVGSVMAVVVLAAPVSSRVRARVTAKPVAEPVSMLALAFMSGCWRGPSHGGAIIEEYYSAPSQNIMLGATRYLKGDRITDYEFTLVELGPTGPVMRPRPKGKYEGHFVPVSIKAGDATWEDPAIDFPRRIVYRHLAPDSLIARIEGASAGKFIEWRMGRAACAGAR